MTNDCPYLHEDVMDCNSCEKFTNPLLCREYRKIRDAKRMEIANRTNQVRL